jgi:hypothetical protein
MSEVVTNLTQQIVDEQKGKLVEKGKDALMDLLGGNKEDNKENTEEESAADNKKDKTEETVNKISEGLKGLFGGKKKDEENK